MKNYNNDLLVIYISADLYYFYSRSNKKKGGNYILDRYRIINRICAHEHSVVWLAEHRTLHAKRIIKGIRRSGPAHDKLAAEATTLMKLSHPGIPSVFDVDEDDEFTYIIEEFIEGETLKDFYLKKDVSEGQLLDHLEQICSVLEYLQGRSIRLIHLDLKPENVIISDRVRIIDLGTAENEGDKGFFRFCTAGYTAPELINGEETGKESDIFSLGKLIRFMLGNSKTGKRTRKKLEMIAKRCTEAERHNRVGSGVIVTKMLRGATKRKSVRAKAGINARNIAVLGLARGCGTTHIAVCLANALAAHEPVVFLQKNRNEELEDCFVYRSKGRLRNRIRYATFDALSRNGVPKTEAGDKGSFPLLQDHGEDVRIVADLGGVPARMFREAVSRFDMVIIVGGGAVWRSEDYNFLERMARGKLLGPGCRVLMNMVGKNASDILPYGIKAFRFPYEENPFSPGAETKKLFGKIVGGS
ncbi:MAG: serine/threonine protein kinase [Lachnospiraceae bacterium]|nr:serine/threonine protein kinase [Lachnospiraceae bacterium]